MSSTTPLLVALSLLLHPSTPEVPAVPEPPGPPAEAARDTLPDSTSPPWKLAEFGAGGLHAALQAAPAPTARDLFRTADLCMGCHNGITTSAGEDISIGYDWRASMMANSARDPYWQAAVRREVTDHPTARAAIEDKCATCHMPMARTEAHLNGRSGEVFANLPVGSAASGTAAFAADGVSCSVCHQIEDVGFGEPESYTGGFTIAAGPGPRPVFGPFEVDAGRTRIMSSATGLTPTRSTHVQESELCATCHTLYTHALDEDGEEVGELPEQVPYLEWRHSAFREERSCQSCHMPEVGEEVPVTGVLSRPRANVSRHVFRGGNFFMLRMLNRYRDELGVTALPQELDTNARRTVEHLETSSATLGLGEVTRAGSRLSFEVEIANLAGHKLPTAYPSRRVWLHVAVRDGTGRVLFESGALRPDGSIEGNDNDADPSRYEPHYTEVTTSDEVPIFEAILVDASGDVTTGLLRGVRYEKDNRLLPRGFDKGSAGPDIAVRGRAAEDPDFRGGGDRVSYRIDLGEAPEGAVTVEARLRYQPVAYRWARNLAGYDAMETQRFVRYYESMAPASAVTLVEVSRAGR